MSLVLCIVLPRFSFVVAAGGSREALARGPAALAPEPGRAQVVGEISPGAEAFGLYPGMRLGEALARCPELALVPADPLGVAAAWEKVLARLESVGAAVESAAPGTAWLDGAQLARLHGRTMPPGSVRANGGTVPPWLPGVLTAVRSGLRLPARIGAGPSRFCALAGALRASPRAADLVDGAAALHDEPVTLLRTRPELASLVEPLERLGLTTMGSLTVVGRSTLAERFGPLGERAHDLASGRDLPLSPRLPGDTLEEMLELPDAGSGVQLTRALGLLIDRLLARRERRGRTFRSVVLGAHLVEGGTWRTRVAFREALADPERMRLALEQQVLLVPAPVQALRLAVDQFGPVHAGARALFDDDQAQRRARLGEATRQVRAAGGEDAALRVLALDLESRVPERRLALTPLQP